jgi:hypothetical protein
MNTNSKKLAGGLCAGLALAAALSATPAAAQMDTPSNYYIPGRACVWDSSGIGIWMCSGPAPSAPVRYTAIALSNSTMATGTSWGYSSRAGAEQRALSECSKRARDCKVVDWAWNQCLALATANDGSWGVDSALYVDIAQARALGQCNKVAKGCVVKLHPCSGD